MSILGPVDRRCSVGARLPSCPTVLDHPIHDFNQMLPNLPHSNALDARMRALEHHVEEVGGESWILETGRLAETYYTLVLALLVLLDHSPRRMVGVGQFGEGVAKGGSTFLHQPQLLGDAAAPILELAMRIAAMLGVEVF